LQVDPSGHAPEQCQRRYKSHPQSFGHRSKDDLEVHRVQVSTRFESLSACHVDDQVEHGGRIPAYDPLLRREIRGPDGSARQSVAFRKCDVERFGEQKSSLRAGVPDRWERVPLVREDQIEVTGLERGYRFLGLEVDHGHSKVRMLASEPREDRHEQ
jgi:hypothetical protein